MLSIEYTLKSIMKQYFLGILLLSCATVISLSGCSKTATEVVLQQTDTLPPFNHLTVTIAKIPVQLVDSSYSYSNLGNKYYARFYDSSISYQSLSLLSNTKKFTFRSHDTISFLFDTFFYYNEQGFDSSNRKIISILVTLDTTKRLIKSLAFNETAKRSYDGHASHNSHSSTGEISFVLFNIPYDKFTMESFECNIPDNLLSIYLGSFNFHSQYSSVSGRVDAAGNRTTTISLGNSFAGSSIFIKLSL